jgi:hypothetical protein
VVAAMRKLLVIWFGVLKTGKRFDPAISPAYDSPSTPVSSRAAAEP